MFLYEYLFIFDCATILLFLLLAHLSYQLGSALKIAPIYRLLYISIALVFSAFGLDSLRYGFTVHVPDYFSAILRFVAGILAVFATLPYWHWLFKEHLKR